MIHERNGIAKEREREMGVIHNSYARQTARQTHRKTE
jgi:hypothetical protein